MAEPYRGSINVDIRDSEPDWAPFEQLGAYAIAGSGRQAEMLIRSQ